MKYVKQSSKWNFVFNSSMYRIMEHVLKLINEYRDVGKHMWLI